MASIREVAKIANVSPATVSRVINGTAKVDEQKKQRVLEAIDETGFKPNELARALFKKSSKIIGMIVPNIENPFFNELARVIEKEAYENGYRILLCNSDDNEEKELMNIQMLNQLKADGIIIMTNSSKTAQEVEKYDFPVVLVDRKFSSDKEMAVVEADNYKGGRMATEHLIKCGCKNIVCMRGPQSLSSAEQRYLGYRDICKEYGLNEQYIECDYSYESGLKKTKELIKKYPDVDGIIASNDMVAISVYKVISKKGYRVPEDIQIIGFDNISFSWLSTPEITTIAQPIKKMGKKAAQIIIQHKKGEEIEKENVFDVKLIQRQTTKIKG
ncbi:MAG: LacI family DNA-binding transcriptional regulator [Intestinibacter sp.]|uniref:LacI family DNA-binding transcriptional regulator n=1 Tax=Intestinibacter sp. TaxID=1965304 RepID=UPI003F14AB96